MKSSKEINKLMAKALNVPMTYDIRHGVQLIEEGLTYEEAEIIARHSPADYSIVSSRPSNYSDDLDITIKAISEQLGNDNTFVLSYESGQWRAAVGNYADCVEFRGDNPAYASCVAFLKWNGKL